MFEVDDRVVVTDKSSNYWNDQGTVKLIDRHGKVWIRRDGGSDRHYESFFPNQLTITNRRSPLQYRGEATSNVFSTIGPTGPAF